MADPVKQLRSWAKRPTAAHWTRICELLDALDGSDLIQALDELPGCFDAWPAELLVAPPRWLERAADGVREPRLQLARAFDSVGAEDLTRALRLARRDDYGWLPSRVLPWLMRVFEGPLNEAYWMESPYGGVSLDAVSVGVGADPGDTFLRALGVADPRAPEGLLAALSPWIEALERFVNNGVLGLRGGWGEKADVGATAGQRAETMALLREAIESNCGTVHRAWLMDETLSHLAVPLPLFDACRGLLVSGDEGGVVLYCRIVTD